jgi:hypothetical protein
MTSSNTSTSIPTANCISLHLVAERQLAPPAIDRAVQVVISFTSIIAHIR